MNIIFRMIDNSNLYDLSLRRIQYLKHFSPGFKVLNINFPIFIEFWVLAFLTITRFLVNRTHQDTTTSYVLEVNSIVDWDYLHNLTALRLDSQWKFKVLGQCE